VFHNADWTRRRQRAQTETMLVVLEKAGYPTGINPLEAPIAERCIARNRRA
jgi:hypothetical protein